MAESKNFSGGCHCGLVRFDVTADLSHVLACNCSICTKRGALWTFVPPEQFALRAPIEGQPGVIHQPVRGELRRMPAIQDRRDEVGSKEGKPQEPRNVGTANSLLCSYLLQG